MRRLLVLPSTTSHKKEPLIATLDVFSRLDLRDLDLNLHHLIEDGVPVDAVRAALAAGGQRVWMVSGGWCDFFHDALRIEDTFRSVERQVDIAARLDVDRIRLFFGRLKREDYTRGARATIAGNLQRLAAQFPEMLFAFENHDGASLDPAICREVLQGVDRPNIRMNFDPINFERAGIDSSAALRELRPLIAHVHLKGWDGSGFCEFGTGVVDLTPLLRELIGSGYRGGFTVEYEGSFDGTLRLFESVARARALVAELEKGSGPRA
jgi:sugar phosphate isomerase/epimerase